MVKYSALQYMTFDWGWFCQVVPYYLELYLGHLNSTNQYLSTMRIGCRTCIFIQNIFIFNSVQHPIYNKLFPSIVNNIYFLAKKKSVHVKYKFQAVAYLLMKKRARKRGCQPSSGFYRWKQHLWEVMNTIL